MDSITQAMLGAVTAQLGFRQRIGRDASWVAALAAYSPDVDSFVAPLARHMGYDVGDMSGMVFHRGLGHSLMMVPVIALIFAALWWFIRRKLLRKNTQDNRHPPTFRLLYACTFVAVLSHPLLDLLTSYGIQLFAPITSGRYAIDTVAIIDVFYSSILIITLVACYVVRKVSRPARRTALIIGWAGFLLSCGYLAAGRATHVDFGTGLSGPGKSRW